MKVAVPSKRWLRNFKSNNLTLNHINTFAVDFHSSYTIQLPGINNKIFIVHNLSIFFSSDTVCVDPREGSSMQSAVVRHQRNWNENNPTDKRYVIFEQ